MIQKYSFSVLWVVAFLCSLFLVNAWQLELFSCAVVMVCVWAVYALTKIKEWQVPSSWPLRIMGAFWLLTFLSVLGSDVLSVSLMGFCLFSAMPLTFLVLSIVGERHHFMVMAKAVGVIYSALAIWALLQVFAFGEYFNWRASHPLNNPNSLSALLSLGFVCTLGWMFGAKESVQKRLALVLAVLLFGGIVASGSRGALFALIPVVMILLVCMRDVARENIRGLAVLAICCVLLFILTHFAGSQGIFNRVVSDVDARDLNHYTNNRLSLWQASVDMIKQHGIFGTGFGTYFLYFPEFRLSDDIFGAYYAHNDPLQYWVELGVLGPALFYAFIISVMGRTVQAMKQAVTVNQRLLILTPFFALGGMIIHTHVTFNLYNLSILFMAGALLGVWFYATQQILKTKVKKITFPVQYSTVVRGGFIALPFIMIVGIFLAYIAGENFNNKARDHMLAGELEEFTEDVLLAQKIGMNGNYRPYLLAVNIPLTMLEQEHEKLDAEKRRNLTQMAWGYLTHVENINPRSSSAFYYMGKLTEIGEVSALPDHVKKPDIYYARALQLDPLHIGSRLALAKIYETNNEREKALNILEQGKNYRYTSGNAMNLYAELTRYYLQNGNVEKSKQIMRKMKAFQARLDRQVDEQESSFGTYLFGS